MLHCCWGSQRTSLTYRPPNRGDGCSIILGYYSDKTLSVVDIGLYGYVSTALDYCDGFEHSETPFWLFYAFVLMLNVFRRLFCAGVFFLGGFRCVCIYVLVVF